MSNALSYIQFVDLTTTNQEIKMKKVTIAFITFAALASTSQAHPVNELAQILTQSQEIVCEAPSYVQERCNDLSALNEISSVEGLLKITFAVAATASEVEALSTEAKNQNQRLLLRDYAQRANIFAANLLALAAKELF